MYQQYSNVDSILVMLYHIVDRDVVVMDWQVHWCVVDISSIDGGRVWLGDVPVLLLMMR